jgi:NhaA family Na+:H+ antiporter
VARARAFTRWIDHDYSAAIGLALGLGAALIWSGLAPSTYARVLGSAHAHGVAASWGVASVRGMVVTGLMTVFFFAIGLEVARELRRGTLTRPEHSVPPLLAAIGGMAATAALSALVGALAHASALRRGWGVPMATDIAFTLGALGLAGRRIPPTVRLFLLTLAVGDDVLSVIVLAFTGRGASALGWAEVVGASLLAWAVVRVGGTPLRLVALAGLWVTFARAGVEPPLAGVVAGALAPWASPHEEPLEDGARRLSTAFSLPLFALVSCGIDWGSLHGRDVRVVAGATVAVRLVGKVLGVGAGVVLARRLGLAHHYALTGTRLAGAALLCACGFTVPLLFAGRLFPEESATYQAFALGLLGATVLAAVGGVALMRRGEQPR